MILLSLKINPGGSGDALYVCGKPLASIEYENESPTDLFTDNQSALALAKNPVSHARAKHIDVRHHFVRDAIQDNVVWVQYIPTEDMTADSLTKALGREKHWKCTTRMGMC